MGTIIATRAGIKQASGIDGTKLCAKRSLAYLAGESPVVEGEPIPLRSESCVIGGNEDDEA